MESFAPKIQLRRSIGLVGGEVFLLPHFFGHLPVGKRQLFLLSDLFEARIHIEHTIMTHPLTKTVMKLNSFHSGVKAMKEIFYSRQHFPKFLGSVTFCSCVGGYMFMDNLYQKRLNVSPICFVLLKCCLSTS